MSGESNTDTKPLGEGTPLDGSGQVVIPAETQVATSSSESQSAARSNGNPVTSVKSEAVAFNMEENAKGNVENAIITAKTGTKGDDLNAIAHPGAVQHIFHVKQLIIAEQPRNPTQIQDGQGTAAGMQSRLSEVPGEDDSRLKLPPTGATTDTVQKVQHLTGTRPKPAKEVTRSPGSSQHSSTTTIAVTAGKAPVWDVDRKFTHSTPEAVKFFDTEDKVRRLMSRGKFIDAKLELADHLPDDGRKIMPNQNLQKMLIECYLMTGSCTEASECLESLVTMMSSSPDQSNPEHLLTVLPTSHQPVQALILLPVISKQFLLRWPPNLANYGIGRCSLVCYDAIESMVKAGDRFKQIPADFAIGIQLRIMEDFQSVNGGDQDARVVWESCILNSIGASYGQFHQHLESGRYYEHGVHLMSHHFGSKAAQYDTFSYLLSNSGTFHKNLGNYVKAEKYISESLRTIELVEGFAVEQKTSFIAEKSEQLQDVRDKLKSL